MNISANDGILITLQPQGNGSWLFLRDGEQVWAGAEFEECIKVARIDSIDEVRKMIDAEESKPREVYAYDESWYGAFRHRIRNVLGAWSVFWRSLSQRFKW